MAWLNKKQVALICVMVQYVFESSEESDSDEEMVVVQLKNKPTRIPAQITVNVFVQVIDNYNDEKFQKNFRLTRRTFNLLLEEIGHLLQNRSGYGRRTKDSKLQLLLALWFFANPDSYREIEGRFHVGVATAVRSVRRVVNALYLVRAKFIHWPDDPLENCNRFELLWNFPSTVAAIDGTHINVPLYRGGQHYINRKNNASVQLQVVADDTRKFIHIYVGQVGSVHDARVFRLSGMQDICNSDDFFPENCHIIGDGAYSIQKHLLVPYKNNGHLTEEQKNFNTRLSSARLVVERAIGLLKIRWRRLLNKLPMIRIDLIPQYIMACCVLHNICILAGDIYHYKFRQRNHQRAAQNNVVSIASKNAGIAKRNAIAQALL